MFIKDVFDVKIEEWQTDNNEYDEFLEELKMNRLLTEALCALLNFNEYANVYIKDTDYKNVYLTSIAFNLKCAREHRL